MASSDAAEKVKCRKQPTRRRSVCSCQLNSLLVVRFDLGANWTWCESRISASWCALESSRDCSGFKLNVSKTEKCFLKMAALRISGGSPGVCLQAELDLAVTHIKVFNFFIAFCLSAHHTRANRQSNACTWTHSYNCPMNKSVPLMQHEAWERKLKNRNKKCIIWIWGIEW